jgi:hypothetical protein
VPYAFAPPYGWTGYAATLDVGRLDEGWYRTVRAFLLRAPQLTVGARFVLGVELAEAVVARLPARPPPGTPPEVFLTAVAAAYQLRYRRGPVYETAGASGPPAAWSHSPAAPPVR